MDLSQTQQTEKLIEEMLDFLESASEDEEDMLLPANDIAFNETSPRNHLSNGNEYHEKIKQPAHDKQQQRKRNTSIGKGLIKIKEEFPLWNTKEIASSKTTPHSHSSVINGIAEPVWNSESSPKAIKKSENDAVTQNADYNDWYNQAGSKNDAYNREVHKAIYGHTQGFPISGSSDYFEAAQNYAVYGKKFMDFPANLSDIMNGDGSGNCSLGLGNANSGQVLNAPEMTDSCNGQFNGYGKPSANIATSICSNAISVAPTVATVASTAAYYQLCNGMQQRPGSANAAYGSTTYGMFLGNKVTYMAAAPTAQALVYNQQTATTSNFISNSLANAALATTPTILYSNPMLNATTQQYLNAFFKETQLLSSAGNSAQANTTTAFYERLVYAQMLQQQIYHQNQQAAAVAAMIQHKQRVNSVAMAAAAAAAAAAVAARQSSNGTTNVTVTNQSNAIPPATSNSSAPVSANGVTSAVATLSPLSTCGRQASLVSSDTNDMPAKQQVAGCVGAQPQPQPQPQPLAINGCDKATNGGTE